MKHPLIYGFRNSVIVNFIILWWFILRKMFSVIVSTKRNSASYFKYDFQQEFEDKDNLTKESTEVQSTEETKNEEKIFSESPVQDFVPQRDCKFMLFTRLNPDEADILVLDDIKSVKNSYFNEKLPVRFLIHGWLDHGDGMLGQLGRKAYLQKGPFNVISLDWSVGADTLNYFKARSAIFQVGPFLAKFIDFLVEKTNISTSDIYLIGHSLGAHIAGIAGKTVTKLKIPVIYGLDPAGPMFFTWQPRERLDVHDAKYVEVLHTSYQGFGKPIGYSDFYANGGKVQPGCNLLTSCSHMRSISYWSESINSETGFYGVPLEDNEAFDDTFDIERKAVMMGGEPGNLGKARGSYKLETHATYPYAMGPLEYSEEVTEQTRFS